MGFRYRSQEFRQEVQQLNHDIMLDPVELQILGTLNDEGRAMRAGQISGLLDITYQLVGKRTEKLRDMDLVSKRQNRGGEPECYHQEGILNLLGRRIHECCLKFLNTPLHSAPSGGINEEPSRAVWQAGLLNLS